MLLSVSEGLIGGSSCGHFGTAALPGFGFSLWRFIKHDARDIENSKQVWSKTCSPSGSGSEPHTYWPGLRVGSSWPVARRHLRAQFLAKLGGYNGI